MLIILRNDFHYRTTEPANAIINPHTFKFTINPARTVCGVNQGANVILVSLVEVSPTAVKERRQIREAWGKNFI
ncbi:hypothetical protein BpHYR1_042981 [Brachionus plicatilis]|uniref:Hexosyltransferase n=1 Tax=Brachionus plicatilis TaxID=10195 RepID=A0A3M7PD78_BRAPC|nr:hypothetical protein BpHYR1_042981 [Brachionus plicatilis]